MNYKQGTRFFHWLTALLIFTAAGIGLLTQVMPMSSTLVRLFVVHKSFGITVIALVVLRIAWHRYSAFESQIVLSASQRQLVKAGHISLYVLMLAMPLSGWLLNSAANFPFKWFGLVSVPMLMGTNTVLQFYLGWLHLLFFIIFVLVITGHIAMAVLHQRQQQPIISAMTASSRLPLFFMGFVLLIISLIISAYLYAKYPLGGADKSVPSDLDVSPLSPVITAEITAASTVTTMTEKQVDTLYGSHSSVWQMDKSQSSLAFTTSYAGEAIPGRFSTFDVSLQFNPMVPESADLSVIIHLNSVDTRSADRDAMLPGEEWFDTSEFPKATYKATRAYLITTDQYQMDGQLSLKGVVAPVSIRFEWLPLTQNNEVDENVPISSETVKMRGSALLDRRTFAIGSGQWQQDETIGFNVPIEFELILIQPTAD